MKKMVNLIYQGLKKQKQKPVPMPYSRPSRQSPQQVTKCFPFAGSAVPFFLHHPSCDIRASTFTGNTVAQKRKAS